MVPRVGPTDDHLHSGFILLYPNFHEMYFLGHSSELGENNSYRIVLRPKWNPQYESAWSESESCSVVSSSLQPHGLYSPWNSLGHNTEVGSLSLLQGIFPTQGSNPNLLHCRQILYQLSHKGSPRILEWVAYPFSSGSSWPRNRTRVSCIAGGFFTNWAIREAYHESAYHKVNT